MDKEGCKADLRSTSSADKQQPGDASPLALDPRMQRCRAAIAMCVFLFLITHGPPAWDRSPVGLLDKHNDLAAQHNESYDSPISDLCDMLGTVSALFSHMDFAFLAKNTYWGLAFGYMRRFDNFANHFRDGSHTNDKVWGMNEWWKMREMMYHSRVLEKRLPEGSTDLRAKWKPDDPMDYLEWWYDLEEKSVQSNGVDKIVIAWCRMPIAEKIERLAKVEKFLHSWLPHFRKNEQLEAGADAVRSVQYIRAKNSGKEVFDDFYNMKSLRKWILGEQQVWINLARERSEVGLKNPAYSGFPLRRHYEKIRDEWEPQLSGQEDEWKPSEPEVPALYRLFRGPCELMPISFQNQEEYATRQALGLVAPRDGSLREMPWFGAIDMESGLSEEERARRVRSERRHSARRSRSESRDEGRSRRPERQRGFARRSL